MGIVGAFMVPHPPVIIPEIGNGREIEITDTIKSYEKVADMVACMKPDTIVVSTPHSVMYSDYFHLSPGERAEGSFADFGADEVRIEADYDQAFVKKLCILAANENVDAGVGGEKSPYLDHGTMIPLYFITKKYVDFDLVRIGLSGLPLTEHYKLGTLIKRTAKELNRRVVYIASGDLSHKLKPDGPYGFVPDGPVYEERIMDVMGRAAFGELFDFDELFLEKVAECGHKSFVMMAGALDQTAVKVNRLSHEGTFGVGYGVCTYEVLPEDGSDRNFLKIYEDKEEIRRSAQRAKEDIIVRLARKTVETYIRDRRKIVYEDVKDSIKKEGEDSSADELIDILENNRAGVFVSMHKDGRLRGCIGTISPVRDNVAQEVIDNAISASTSDPRFIPVSPDELDHLEYSVDVLSPPENIASLAELDVKKYGVIVTNGNRRGLLLPNLDTIDTVEEQIAIAKKKAGISSAEPVSLQRFEVIRHT